MAKAKTKTVTLTPAEQKLVTALLTKKHKLSAMGDKVDDLRDEADDLETEADNLETEIESDEEEITDEVMDRLEQTATAEADRLNKANKDPKIEYGIEVAADAVITLERGKHIYVETWKVVKEKKIDPVAELRNMAKRLGYKIDKDVAERVLKAK
jgi:paraquat-inducible protein B